MWIWKSTNFFVLFDVHKKIHGARPLQSVQDSGVRSLQWEKSQSW
jgi:hypothetical protein